MHDVPCCAATVYAVLLWHLLSAFGKLNTYIHTYYVDRVSLKHDGTDGPDGTAYTDKTAGLVADGTDYKDGTAIQLLVEQTEQPIQTRQPFMEQTGQPLYRRDSYVDV